MPLFWTGASSKNFHKAIENSNSCVENNQYQIDNLFRRHSVDGKNLRDEHGEGHIDLSFSTIRICDKSKVSVNSNKSIGIFRLGDSRTMTLTLPKDKVANLTRKCLDLISNPQTTTAS